MRKLVRHAVALFVVMGAVQSWLCAQAQQSPQEAQPVLHGYQKAPQPISDILSAPTTPLVLPSPDGKWLLAIDRLANPPVADLAQPMLRLAGLRINPATNGRHHPPRLIALSLVEVATGKTHKVTGSSRQSLPQPARLVARRNEIRLYKHGRRRHRAVGWQC